MIHKIGQKYGLGNQATKPSSSHQCRIKITVQKRVATIKLTDKRYNVKYMSCPLINYPFSGAAKKDKWTMKETWT